jgi:hypothetical protein
VSSVTLPAHPALALDSDVGRLCYSGQGSILYAARLLPANTLIYSEDSSPAREHMLLGHSCPVASLLCFGGFILSASRLEVILWAPASTSDAFQKAWVHSFSIALPDSVPVSLFMLPHQRQLKVVVGSLWTTFLFTAAGRHAGHVTDSSTSTVSTAMTLRSGNNWLRILSSPVTLLKSNLNVLSPVTRRKASMSQFAYVTSDAVAQPPVSSPWSHIGNLPLEAVVSRGVLREVHNTALAPSGPGAHTAAASVKKRQLQGGGATSEDTMDATMTPVKFGLPTNNADNVCDGTPLAVDDSDMKSPLKRRRV